MNSNFRNQLLKIQIKNYSKNLKIIEQSLDQGNSVKKYAREYRNCIKTFEAISSKTELIRAILSSDIVYHGDYHTLKQSQRSVLRVLRDIAEKRKIILCLEMFYSSDQSILDSFMSGRLGKDSFLKKIKYSKKWGFKFENWFPIIELCRKYKIPIVGINSDQEMARFSLIRRDIFSAKIIGKTVIQNLGKLIYVVDGDYHVAPVHLPKRVDKVLGVFDIVPKKIIVYQNADNLYWELVKEKLEESDVLKISENIYCIMNTIPSNKLQSYLNWIDLTEDAYYPVNKEWFDDSFEESYTNSIPELVKTICSILDFNYPDRAFDHLVVYYGYTPGFVNNVEGKLNFAPVRSYVKTKVSRNEGFLLEYKKDNRGYYLIYLPNSNLNMAAEEAAHFINSVYRGVLMSALNAFDEFYRYAMAECLGFFGSKLINEKRKTNSISALREFLKRSKKQKLSREDAEKVPIAHLILKHRALEKYTQDPLRFQLKFKTIYRSSSYRRTVFSTQLGYMLGEKLFKAVKKDRYLLKSVKDLFQMTFDKPNQAFLTYIKLNCLFRKRKKEL